MSPQGDDGPEHDAVVAPSLRRCARVVLLDDSDRVLLFSTTNRDGSRRWFTVGGGVEPGETLRQAALREIEEETGLTGAPLGPMVWRGRPRNTVRDGTPYRVHQFYFMMRVTTFDVDLSGFEPFERSSVTGWRWWTVKELSETTDLLRPNGLVLLISELLTSGPPDDPILVDG